MKNKPTLELIEELKKRPGTQHYYVDGIHEVGTTIRKATPKNDIVHFMSQEGICDILIIPREKQK